MNILIASRDSSVTKRLIHAITEAGSVAEVAQAQIQSRTDLRSAILCAKKITFDIVVTSQVHDSYEGVKDSRAWMSLINQLIVRADFERMIFYVLTDGNEDAVRERFQEHFRERIRVRTERQDFRPLAQEIMRIQRDVEAR